MGINIELDDALVSEAVKLTGGGMPICSVGARLRRGLGLTLL